MATRKTAPILQNISLYAKPGQKIAFVGSTGAGKTTITNLINRFYDIDAGSVTYDGIDVRDIAKDSLRQSLGIVLQDTHLFTGTIADNIRFGKLDATREEIVRAARIANADSFIRRLPQGYDTRITSDGASLSQGQRQLLAIARAAVADPPVLILDEATSSIDTRTEALIEKGMDQLMEGRTVFVIAHRLSTVRNANAIIVLEHGQVVERGDHDALLAQKGRILPAVQRDVRAVVTPPRHDAKNRPPSLPLQAGRGAGFHLTSVKVSWGPGWYSRRPIISSRQITGAWQVSWKYPFSRTSVI